MHATEKGNDLLLLRRAAVLICDWRRRTSVRAAAQRGTAQVLCWQSRELRATSARLAREAESLVTQSMRLRQAQGSTDADIDLQQSQPSLGCLDCQVASSGGGNGKYREPCPDAC
jgi:hypothetical protein